MVGGGCDKKMLLSFLANMGESTDIFVSSHELLGLAWMGMDFSMWGQLCSQPDPRSVYMCE